MSEQIAVELRVLGHNFRLATTETEKADLEHAAELLNENKQLAQKYNITHFIPETPSKSKAEIINKILPQIDTKYISVFDADARLVGGQIDAGGFCRLRSLDRLWFARLGWRQNGARIVSPR